MSSGFYERYGLNCECGLERQMEKVLIFGDWWIFGGNKNVILRSIILDSPYL